MKHPGNKGAREQGYPRGANSLFPYSQWPVCRALLASRFLRQILLGLRGLIDVVLVVDVAILLQLVIAGCDRVKVLQDIVGRKAGLSEIVFPTDVAYEDLGQLIADATGQH